MKKLILTLGILITLSGCGYDSYEECKLREQQECGADNVACNSSAIRYCKKEFPETNLSNSSDVETKKSLNLKKIGVNILLSVFFLISLILLITYKHLLDQKDKENFSWFEEIWTLIVGTFLFFISLGSLFESSAFINQYLLFLVIPYFAYMAIILYKKRMALRKPDKK